MTDRDVSSLVEQLEKHATHLQVVRGWTEQGVSFLREAASRLSSPEGTRDDLGLSIDMTDADRLRLWADRIAEYGDRITEWGSPAFVVEELRRIAAGVEKAVRDVGVLRQCSPGCVDCADESSPSSAPAATPAMSEEQLQTSDIRGLAVDMLDVDRLRQWAKNLMTYGTDITHWASLSFVVAELEALARNIEKTVHDVGALRASCAPGCVDCADDQVSVATPAPDKIAFIVKALRCAHTNRAGGNDYIICNDCQFMWDYRREPEPTPHLLKFVADELFRLSAVERPAPTCEWKQEDVDDNTWATGCGDVFQFMAEGPVENRQKFCGYCGKSLKVVVPAPPAPVAPKEDK